MLTHIRRLPADESGATAFENGLIAVLAFVAIVSLLGQVEGSISDVFRDSAIQADTEREMRRW